MIQKNELLKWKLKDQLSQACKRLNANRDRRAIEAMALEQKHLEEFEQDRNDLNYLRQYVKEQLSKL